MKRINTFHRDSGNIEIECVFGLNDLMDIILRYSNDGEELCDTTRCLRLVNLLFCERTNQLIKEAHVFNEQFQSIYCFPNISILHIEGPRDIDMKKDTYREIQRTLLTIPMGLSLTTHLRHLVKLVIQGNHYAMTEEFVQSIASNLRSFHVCHNKFITDTTVSLMIHLESLCLGPRCKVTNKTLHCLTQLKKLVIKDTLPDINNDGLCNLTRLETLSLSTTGITDEGLGYLKNLQHLTLCFNDTITDRGLSQLTQLKTLTLVCHWKITVDGICMLPELEKIIFDRYTDDYWIRPIEECLPDKVQFIE
jgi:hypothetical protein